jgi:hypothetical protein
MLLNKSTSTSILSIKKRDPKLWQLTTHLYLRSNNRDQCLLPPREFMLRRELYPSNISQESWTLEVIISNSKISKKVQHNNSSYPIKLKKIKDLMRSWKVWDLTDQETVLTSSSKVEISKVSQQQLLINNHSKRCSVWNSIQIGCNPQLVHIGSLFTTMAVEITNIIEIVAKSCQLGIYLTMHRSKMEDC